MFNKGADIPDPKFIRVCSRENTGVGRFTYLDFGSDVSSKEECFGLGEYSHIEMVGITSGLFVQLCVGKSQNAYLELKTYGSEPWDGVERIWFIPND
jgi:hypothetical protein